MTYPYCPARCSSMDNFNHFMTKYWTTTKMQISTAKAMTLYADFFCMVLLKMILLTTHSTATPNTRQATTHSHSSQPSSFEIS